MEGLLRAMRRGLAKTKEIRGRWAVTGFVLSKSDGAELKEASAEVTKYLSLCVAEVAAGAMPQLQRLQSRLAEAAVLTASDKAKLDALRERPLEPRFPLRVFGGRVAPSMRLGGIKDIREVHRRPPSVWAIRRVVPHRL